MGKECRFKAGRYRPESSTRGKKEKRGYCRRCGQAKCRHQSFKRSR